MSSKGNIPAEFQKLIKELLGNESDDFFESLQSASPASIRINPSKYKEEFQARPIPWSAYGRYLSDRPIYTLDPLLHAGAYYVQEPSSMFLEHVIGQVIDKNQNVLALDLCAAPGGKSTHLLSILTGESTVVSNEVIRSRASVLTENCIKWGYPNSIITQSDPAAFKGVDGLFDLILVDAPCSGEGLFRKDPAAIKEWSIENVGHCSLRQQRILTDVWPALKENGILIYSTCTFNEIENEGTLNRLADSADVEFLSLQLPPEWGIKESRNKKSIGYRFYPHAVNGEGFFLAVLKKTSGSYHSQKASRKGLVEIPQQEKAVLKNWLQETAFRFIHFNHAIHAIPSHSVEVFQTLSQTLAITHAGIPLAVKKQDKYVPEHAAALTTKLNREHFHSVELTLDEAIQYLRKEVMQLETSGSGFTLVTYKNTPLGWINVLQNRINNLYPSAWRIRMQN